MKALIIGVSGQDGSYLARFLLKKGYSVAGTSRSADENSFNNLRHLGIYGRVELRQLSIVDFTSVVNTLLAYRPDEIYNLAGQSSVGLSFRQPLETVESIVTGTLNILEAIRQIGLTSRYYNAGSSECFGDTGGQAATIDTPFRPRSPYAVAKCAAHWHVANYRDAYGLHACTGVLFNHESPLRQERFVTMKTIATVARIRSGSRERLRLGNIDIRRDWGWAPDFVEAMWLLLQEERAQDCVIATGVSASLREFVARAFEIQQLDWREYVDIDTSLYRPADILSNLGNPLAAQRTIGWVAKTKMPALVDRLSQEWVRFGG